MNDWEIWVIFWVIPIIDRKRVLIASHFCKAKISSQDVSLKWKGKGNRRKEVNDGFTFPALIQKIRVMPNHLLTPQTQSFWFTAFVESFRKAESFSVIESKHSSADKWVRNWINFTGSLKWLGNVLHGKSMTETCESLSSVMLQSFESLSVIQSFFHSYYRIKCLSHCKMLQSFWFGPSHWVIFSPLRRSHWSSDWNCECNPNHWRIWIA